MSVTRVDTQISEKMHQKSTQQLFQIAPDVVQNPWKDESSRVTAPQRWILWTRSGFPWSRREVHHGSPWFTAVLCLPTRWPGGFAHGPSCPSPGPSAPWTGDATRRGSKVPPGLGRQIVFFVSQGVTGPNGPKLKLQDAFDGTQDTMGERANEPPTGAICS